MIPSDERERRREAARFFKAAFARHMNGEVDHAILLYTKSLEIIPTAEAHTFRGWSYSLRREFGRAIEECQKAIDLDPSFGNPYNDIGAYLIQQGKLDEAIPWLMQALKARRYNARCHPYVNLGRICEMRLEWSEAIRYYELALKEAPGYMLAQESLQRLVSMMN